MSHYNGNMFKLKRISLFLLFFIVSLNLFAASKAKKYDYLLKEGSLEEITEAITKDNDFYRMTFGSEKNTILSKKDLFQNMEG